MTSGPAGAQFRLESLRRVQCLCLAALIYAGLAAELWAEALQLADPFDLVDLLSLSHEANVPTWFASAQLLICSVLLAAVAIATRQSGGRYVAHWWGLAAALLYISIDETVQLHEEMNHWFEMGGVLYFGWVIPAAVIVALFGLSYLGFLAHLPKRTRNRFVLAGAIFVGGALGIELLLGYWTDLEGDDNLVYSLIDWIEESMELCGIGLMLHSVVAYMVDGGEFNLRFASGRERDADAADAAAAKKPFRAATLLGIWTSCVILGGLVTATGLSTVFHYENDRGFHLERPRYVGEDLTGEMRGGKRFTFAREVRVFDQQPEARSLLVIALGAAALMASVVMLTNTARR